MLFERQNEFTPSFSHHIYMTIVVKYEISFVDGDDDGRQVVDRRVG
jgi:hypothetical protein